MKKSLIFLVVLIIVGGLTYYFVADPQADSAISDEKQISFQFKSVYFDEIPPTLSENLVTINVWDKDIKTLEAKLDGKPIQLVELNTESLYERAFEVRFSGGGFHKLEADVEWNDGQTQSGDFEFYGADE